MSPDIKKAVRLGIASTLILGFASCGSSDKTEQSTPVDGYSGIPQEFLVDGHAWTIKDYFSDGVSFRHKVKELIERNDPQAQEFDNYYKTLKSGGREYLKANEPLEPHKEQVFEIDAPGDKGINLQHPVVEGPTRDVSVYDKARVKIVDYPTRVINEANGISENYWPVEIVADSPLYILPNEAPAGSRGYISQWYLGDVIKTPDKP